MKALGAKRRRWFEYGIAATRTTSVARGRKNVSALAQRVVGELMRTGVARDEVFGALVVAAWAVLETASTATAKTPSC